MNYPLISEYIESIMSAEDNFDQLSSLRPVLDSYGNPVMSSGNFAVVFNMKDIDTGKFYAVKCFIKDQEGRNESYAMIADELKNVNSQYILPIKFLEKELFVDSTQSDETEFPVLVMDWVEGKTLDAYLRENLDNQYLLQVLAYHFCQMAAWLLAQPFAHGDLKPDNILVREDGSLVLVDYDGFYVPAMKGDEARELGSPDFRHPQRTPQDFDEHIDDFSISTIALSLKAISIDAQLYHNYAASDRLLLSANDYHDIGSSKTMQKICQLASDSELAMLLSAFYMAMANVVIELKLFQSIILRNNLLWKSNIAIKLSKEILEKVYTIVVHKEINGDYYAKIEFISSLKNKYIECKISKKVKCKKGDFIIPNSAIIANLKQFKLEILLYGEIMKLSPFFLTGTGYSNIIHNIHITSAKEKYGNLKRIEISNEFKEIGVGAFKNEKGLLEVIIPNSVTMIGHEAFRGCSGLIEITIPNSVKEINSSAFEGCVNLIEVVIPSSVRKIGGEAFKNCYSLKKIVIPSSVSEIGGGAFENCKNLEEVIIPDSVTWMGAGIFENCSKLKKVTLPSGIDHITWSAFSGCTNLEYIKIPNNITEIGNSAFRNCRSLKKIEIPESVIEIGIMAFANCIKLSEIEIPNTIKKIGIGAFNGIEEIICNDEFIYEDKCLYDKRKSKILTCNKKEEKIKIHEGVIEVYPDVFFYNPNYLILPMSLSRDCLSRLEKSDIKYLQIPNGFAEKYINYRFSNKWGVDEVYIDDYGVVYSKDKATLIHFSLKIDVESYKILDDCRELGSMAFEGDVSVCYGGGEVDIYDIENNLKELYLPRNLIKISENAFYGCRKDIKIIIPKTTRQRFEEIINEFWHSNLVEMD